MSSHAKILYNKFKKDTFKIAATSPRGIQLNANMHTYLFHNALQ